MILFWIRRKIPWEIFDAIHQVIRKGMHVGTLVRGSGEIISGIPEEIHVQISGGCTGKL